MDKCEHVKNKLIYKNSTEKNETTSNQLGNYLLLIGIISLIYEGFLESWAEDSEPKRKIGKYINIYW